MPNKKEFLSPHTSCEREGNFSQCRWRTKPQLLSAPHEYKRISLHKHEGLSLSKYITILSILLYKEELILH